MFRFPPAAAMLLPLTWTGWLLASPAAADMTPDGQKLFNARCAACHSVRKGGPSGMGPNLNAVIGRRAGSLPGFVYSPALKADGRLWDVAHLDAFLAAPQKAVPGTRMPIATPDPAPRAAIVAYLGSFK